MKSCRICLALVMGVCLLNDARAQDAKTNEKERPVILMASPLGVPFGATTKVVLRGQRFGEIGGLSVRTGEGFPDSDQHAKTLGPSKSVPVPNMLKADKVGDWLCEFELTMPAAKADGVKVGEAEIVVHTAKGSSMPYKLLVGGEFPLVEEKEPNDGFATAQSLGIGSIVSGAIHDAKNVDVFAIEGRAGDRIVAEVVAARRGSALDAVLTLYDARGTVVAQNDDQPGSADAKLDAKLSTAGRYLLVLQDANDLGGPTHPYRLVVHAGAK